MLNQDFKRFVPGRFDIVRRPRVYNRRAGFLEKRFVLELFYLRILVYLFLH